MNSNTQQVGKTNPPDLIVMPQNGTTIPNSNLSLFEQEAVQRDWENFGHTPTVDNAETWTIQVWHVINGTPRPTSTLTLPKQTVQPAQHPAKHADNDASKQASSAPQSAG